jgi:DNA-binding NarL/FixJ family response regulator
LKISIHLVDDQQLVRDGLAALLSMSEHVTVCGQDSGGDAFLQRFQQGDVEAQVILLDMRMPEGDGLSVLRGLQQAQNRGQSVPACLVLTTFDDAELMADALHAGACGYWLKDTSLEVLVQAIERVANGELALQPELTLKALSKQRSDAADTIVLNEAETALLSLMAEGLSNRDIAARIFKAEGTVRNQVSALLAKLEVSNRTQAIAKGLQNGWVSL